MLSLISQLNEEQKLELFKLIQKKYGVKPIEHNSLSSIMLLQDKELHELIKAHRLEIINFIGDKNGRVKVIS